MIQDVGSEFGPKKVDIANWRVEAGVARLCQVPRLDKGDAL